MDLTLKEAAKYLGFPANQLHSLTWSKQGPKPIDRKRYWQPTYRQEDLDEWLKQRPEARK